MIVRGESFEFGTVYRSDFVVGHVHKQKKSSVEWKYEFDNEKSLVRGSIPSIFRKSNNNHCCQLQKKVLNKIIRAFDSENS